MQRLILLAVLIWNTALSAEPITYQVDSANSYIHIYTGTDGLLQAFSHKHLIAATQIEGEIRISDEGNSAHLVIQLHDLLVDDNTERASAADPEFRAPVSESIQTGTRENMLSERFLDAVNFPEITLDIELDKLSSAPLFDVFVHLLGQTHQLQIPAILNLDKQQISATGYHQLTHSDLGLEPYSVMVGLLKVAEELRIQFEIVAHASKPAIAIDSTSEYSRQ